ncbi:MAG: exo-alpha-sialidase [Planctomycetaceae bacterium]|nr:exo-alpha-sialidase [Planctomycetaceae bacterium]
MLNRAPLIAFVICSVFSVLFQQQPIQAAPPKTAKIIEVKKIWDKAPHNAFTDLIRFKDQWYCVFREGKGHVSPDGALRVLRSSDGKQWTAASLVTSKTADLRDAKIAISPQGQLVLAGAGALHQPAAAKHQSFIWYSDDGNQWSEAIPIGDPNYWIWRVVWNKKTAYGIGYKTVSPRGTRLYKSEDGKKFETVVPAFDISGYANETAIHFESDGSALCVIRRDGKPNDALLGTSSKPYTQWSWKSLGMYVGGPQMIKLPDGRFVVAGRDLRGGAKTKLWWLDPNKAELKEIIALPSGGDTSYPGMVYHNNELWVSYYSSHEGKTSIYMARVKLPSK